MNKYSILILSILLLSCFKRNDDIKYVQNTFDSSFYTLLKQKIFIYEVDPPDTFYSKYLKINYITKQIEIQNIDTISFERRKEINYYLTKLLLNNDSLAIVYFRTNTKLNRFILGEVTKTVKSNIVLDLYYSYDFDSLNIITSKILYLDTTGCFNKYILDEPAVDEIYKYNKNLVREFFPLILRKYKLEFYQEVYLKCYLYLTGEQSYLLELLEGKLNNEQKRIVDLYLKSFNITNALDRQRHPSM